MENDMTRVLTEIFIKKALKDLKDSPERSIRNLVNMALDFSESRLHRIFFESAEIMLKNIQSPYYDIIRDSALHIDRERLFRFGMNLCYNSCTAGANKIRKNEKIMGFNIPWAISIKIDEMHLAEQPEIYSYIITRGKKLGIYTWMLYCSGKLRGILPLIKKHNDCAFVLFCEPENLTDEFLNDMFDVKHIMIAVRYKENTEEILRLLREKKLLYSVYYIYGEEEAENIINGNLFYYAGRLHPLFTAVISKTDCLEETSEKVYRAVLEFRKKQTFRTVVLDLKHDNRYIDNIISDECRAEEFDLKKVFTKLKQQEG